MKKLLCLFTAMTMVFALAACGNGGADQPGSAAPDAEKAKLGIVVPDLNNAFCSQMAGGIERAAAENGYEVVTVKSNADPEADVASIENMDASGVKAYYGLHIGVDSIGDLLKNQYPQIGCLTQTTFDGEAAHVVEDYHNIAVIFCESLDAFIEEKGMESVEICGIWLSNCLIQGTAEYEGYTTITGYIEEHYAGTNVTYVTSQYPQNAEEAGNYTETLLNGYENARVFFCYNNDFAIATANTISAAVSDSADYYVFSSETDDESFRLIADDSSPYRGAASGDTEETGYQVGLQLINWVENGTMENVPVVKTLCDWRNVSDFLAE